MWYVYGSEKNVWWAGAATVVVVVNWGRKKCRASLGWGGGRRWGQVGKGGWQVVVGGNATRNKKSRKTNVQPCHASLSQNKPERF